MFNQNDSYTGPSTCRNKKAWDNLVSPDGGFVLVPEHEKYSLPPGLSSKCGPDRYVVSMFHQLHCLSLIRTTLYELAETDMEIYMHGLSIIRHLDHCFDYMRQAVQCAGDTTLEHAYLDSSGHLAVDGWGVEHKQCRDYDSIYQWQQNNTCARDPMGPASCCEAHMQPFLEWTDSWDSATVSRITIANS